jgi:histidyl-tRNA synthetase
VPVAGDLEALARAAGVHASELAELEALRGALVAAGLADWCEFDLGIVRGLAYYTGTVFEIHEASGAERAIAGGGRYDGLVELFGGPRTPAMGFGMGDVVLGLVLADRGLLPKDGAELLPRPDAFVVSAGEPAAEEELPRLVARLRAAGLHVRHSYKATRNVGKLLADASKQRARWAVILGTELAQGQVQLKDLASGEQRVVPLADVTPTVRRPPAPST